MFRPLPATLIPLAALAAGALAAPAAARDNAPYYQAELTAPAASNRVIAGGVLWFCDGTQCVAAKGSARPAVMCKRLAAETAPVARFSYEGKDLDGEELRRCNG